MSTLMQSPDIYGGAQLLDELTASFMRLLQLKSVKLYMHSQQVANYAASVAAKMRLPPAEIELIRLGALLHDIGQLTVPNAVMAKIPYLSTREMSVYKKHCDAGSNMLENIPCFQEAIPLIRYHHECWDGSGYPKRMKGVNIPLGARIISVVNYYDRFINPCTQNWAKTKKEAVSELNARSGKEFDPNVVKAFIESLG